MCTYERYVTAMKTCVKCGEAKPVAEFVKRADAPDGFRGKCKACHNISTAKWRTDNPDKMQGCRSNWDAANPGRPKVLDPVKRKARSAKYFAMNREKALVANAKWRAANPDKQRAAVAKCKAANPESRRIESSNRRALKLGNGGKLSKGLSERLLKLQLGICGCGCQQQLDDKFHLDHWVPLILGGPNEDANIRLLLATCNLRKSSKHPDEYVRQRGFLL